MRAEPLPLLPPEEVPRDVVREEALFEEAALLARGFTSTVAFDAEEEDGTALLAEVAAAASALERRRGVGVAIGLRGVRIGVVERESVIHQASSDR